MMFEPDKRADWIERFLVSCANGEMTAREEFDRAQAILEALKDQKETITYPFPLPNGEVLYLTRKSRLESLSIDSMIQRIQEWIENHKPENEPEPNNGQVTDSPTVPPLVWKWGPADLGWLHEALTRAGAIQATPKEFSQHFMNQDNRPFTDDLGSAYKGQSPKRIEMRNVRNSIMHHDPQEKGLSPDSDT